MGGATNFTIPAPSTGLRSRQKLEFIRELAKLVLDRRRRVGPGGDVFASPQQAGDRVADLAKAVGSLLAVALDDLKSLHAKSADWCWVRGQRTGSCSLLLSKAS